YWVCGGWQDNNAWCGPAFNTDPSGVQNKNWVNSTGGDGEWAIPEPGDPNWIWADAENGSLLIYNRVTKDAYTAQPYFQTGIEAYDNRVAKIRWNWESPIAFAPWPIAAGAKSTVAWYGGNVLFQTADRGKSWTVISPDLTRDIKQYQAPSGGPITHDVSNAEEMDTILDIEASPLARGEIWIGTDDGLVQLTRDWGKHWSNVTPPGAPQLGRFATVAPSTLDDGTAYAIADAHYVGDNAPYAWVTHDFGKHWRAIVGGLPNAQWVRAIRPDIRDRNVVYLGTEEGIWISFDGGGTWQSFENGMPPVSVHDIRMQPAYDDLVIATHGRSVYILDDARPIQELQQAIARGTWLFAPRTSYLWNQHSSQEETYTEYTAPNPPYGALLTFYQKQPQATPPKLEVLDANGRVIDTISGTHKVNGKDQPRIPNKAGLNRFRWNLNVQGPVKWTGAAKEEFQGPSNGPQVVPGTYGLRLTLGTQTFATNVRVLADPRSTFTQADYVRSYQLGLHVRESITLVDTMLNNLDTVKKSLDAAHEAATKAGNTALATKIDEAQTARQTVFDELTANYQNDEDSIQFPGKILEDVKGNYYNLGSIVTKPIVESVATADAEVRQGATHYNAFVSGVLPATNAALQAAKLEAVPSSVTTVKLP
ncbi:MAG: hypothetical protein JO199_11290, partial [Candidatus Eremiobacteraeota bacterium]|nr:hypothetical protein [Candidatus Eremiobacteraeota bacterium]